MIQQAATLATQIREQGRQADRLSEQVDAARLQVTQIAAQRTAAQASLDKTSVDLDRSRVILAHQALAAYMQGGRQTMTYLSGDTADDKVLINGYASAIAGIQQRDVTAFENLRRTQAAEEQTLAVAEDSATASAEQLSAAQESAQAAAAREQQTLSNIGTQSQLSSLVAAAEASQYQATATVVQARFLPSGSVPVVSPTAGPPSAPLPPGLVPTAGGPVLSPGPVTTAGPATTAAVVTATQTERAPETTATPVSRAPTTTLPRTLVTTAPSAPPAPPSGASAAIAYAYAQIGKPYVWGAAGPDSFDCSGLVMQAWARGGFYFDHLAQDQYAATARVAISALQPGDLVFFGTPDDVYHDGIYVGNGQMVDAPHTGADVRVEGIYWSDLLAGGRVV